MEPIYQCCYTNATQSAWDKVTSGWQATIVSPDIPQDAYETCVKLQNANASLCASAVDEQGNVLNLQEIVGDGSYLYVIHTQFGLTDRLGRPNLFSHAVIFPLRNNRDVLWNPNFYLALHPSAFLTGGERFTWEKVPIYNEPSLSLEEAMRRAGLDRERYATLVKCIYAQSSGSKGAKPLYIEYDGTARQLRGLLTCIYEGIPWYMRRSLRIASCPTANDGSKDLVFSRNARTKGSYLIPQTGENDILTTRVERKIQRYGFIDYAARELPLEDFPAHFERLERIAIGLGDMSASNNQILKLAFYFWTRDVSAYTNEELESNLSDALRLPPADNQLLENFLIRMLTEADRRGLHPTDESRTLLDAWMSTTKSEELKAAGRKYKQ